MKTRKSVYFLSLIAAAVLSTGCGSWAGNPSDDDDGDDDGQSNPPPATGPGGIVPGQTTPTLPGGSLIAEPGDVLLQKIVVKAGQSFRAALKLNGAGFRLQGDDAPKDAPFELSVLSEDGTEVAYVREDQSDPAIEFTATEDSEVTVAVKSNEDEAVTVQSATVEGAESAAPLQNANDRTHAPFKDVLIKAVVAFGRSCKVFNAAGNIDETKAESGKYFAQPFVFLGKVAADKKVTPLSDATIELVAGETRLRLTKVGDFDPDVLSDHSLPKDPAVVKTFYQGYFGAAGEMYTTDTFLYGGDCAAAPQFDLGTDVGLADIQLVIKDASIEPAIDASFPVRATVAPAFSMYTGEGEKLEDYTQCTYDRLTGEPKTYNGDATECKTFSFVDPPYITLDYLMPSGTEAGVTSVSDPTRILFYGHAYAKAWYTTLIENSTAIANDETSTVSLPGCLNIGGMSAVPVSTTRTYMPLGEFNAVAGDVINLARRPGSYTALTDYWQGNVDTSGELDYTTCVPHEGATCDVYKTLTVKMDACSLKADSGISVMAVGDSFIYPAYFEMSGVLAE
jgi:hypothetical protein